MNQRDEHLLGSLPPARNVILHDRDAAREAVLIPQPLKYPLRRVLLLLRSAFVFGQDAIDDRNERIKLRPGRRLRPPIPGRHGEFQHLVDGPRIDAKPPRHRPLAQPLDPNCMTYLRIEFHVLHPSRPLPNQAKSFQLPDFYSGELPNHSVASSEGFLLRRLH